MAEPKKMAFRNIQMLKRSQYESIEDPTRNDLWAVETETYSDDNGNWYRIYPDGWCEQGGKYGDPYQSYTTKTFNFLVPFRDNNYFAITQSAHTGDLYYPAMQNKTTTYVTFYGTYNTGGYGNWFTCGYIN